MKTTKKKPCQLGLNTVCLILLCTCQSNINSSPTERLLQGIYPIYPRRIFLMKKEPTFRQTCCILYTQLSIFYRATEDLLSPWSVVQTQFRSVLSPRWYHLTTVLANYTKQVDVSILYPPEMLLQQTHISNACSIHANSSKRQANNY